MVEALVRSPRLIKERGVEKNLRRGRGFSLNELKEAGISVQKAKKLGIPIDFRRRSTREWNVETLRKYLETLGK